MAPRRPSTSASLTYALRAVTYALQHLARDARVLELWQAWCLTRPGIGPHGLDPVALKAWRVVVTSGGDRSALDTALDADREVMLAEVAGFCRDALGMPYVWLPSVLVDCFRLWVDDIVEGRLAAGHERRVLAYQLDEDWRTIVPPGRVRDNCEHDVACWYGARVKERWGIVDAGRPTRRSRNIDKSPVARQEAALARATADRQRKAIKRVEAALTSLTLEQVTVLH